MRHLHVHFIAAALALVTGCGDLPGQRDGLENCTTEARPGVALYLRDSTGYPISDATITARDGAYSEILFSFDDGNYAGAYERTGDYTLLIEIPGMSDTEIGPLEVRMADVCHVQTQRRSLEFYP